MPGHPICVALVHHFLREVRFFFNAWPSHVRCAGTPFSPRSALLLHCLAIPHALRWYTIFSEKCGASSMPGHPICVALVHHFLREVRCFFNAWPSHMRGAGTPLSPRSAFFFNAWPSHMRCAGTPFSPRSAVLFSISIIPPMPCTYSFNRKY